MVIGAPEVGAAPGSCAAFRVTCAKLELTKARNTKMNTQECRVCPIWESGFWTAASVFWPVFIGDLVESGRPPYRWKSLSVKQSAKCGAAGAEADPAPGATDCRTMPTWKAGFECS